VRADGRPPATHPPGGPAEGFCSRVFHNDTSTPAAIRPKVTLSDTAAGILPTMPTRKILLPMKTSTPARAYFRYLKRWIIAASAKYRARRPRMAKMLLV
jgi:hypothetical protein